METQLKKGAFVFDEYVMEAPAANEMNDAPKPFSRSDMATVFEKTNEHKNFFQQDRKPNAGVLLTLPSPSVGKKSFLVFKHNKYITVPTENIAFFYVKYESSVMMCFDRNEYFVNYSLEQIQHLLTDNQFFRLNRQYLINFYAIKEVEHYFARKLLVNLVLHTTDKLLVSKEKARSFLNWLADR